MKTVDMEEAMEKDAIEVASYALNEFNVESQMANHIKREFDKKYRCVASRGTMRSPCVWQHKTAQKPVHLTCPCIALRLCACPSPCSRQPYMARGDRHKFRLARRPRDQELHLLLPWAEGHLALQERLD